MKKKHFLKLPEYPGGKEEFRKYIHENLKYPESALKNSVEGIVYVSAEINDDGEVLSAHIEKGIGHGCDEEAVRLINGLHFGGVKNRGRRVKTKKKFKIQFRIKKTIAEKKPKQTTISYNLKTEKKTDNKEPDKIVYSYSINLNSTS
jgi:TonB family protein